MSAISSREQKELERANGSGAEPVVFVHGLWLLASSWDRWRERFEDAGYVTLAPSWPDDPESVDEARRHPEVFARKTVKQVADHFADVVRQLSTPPAIVGHSFGGLIALQLALDSPELVHSIALLEPPLRMVPSGKASFEQINLPMMNAYRAGDKHQAVQLFSDAVFGPNWQAIVEQAVPGGVEQADRDLDTFIQEQAAFQDWQFGPKQAAAITQPVLSMLGAAVNNPFMQEGRSLLHSWLPQTEDYDVPTTHLLQMQDPASVATGLSEFFSRHPIKSSPALAYRYQQARSV